MPVIYGDWKLTTITYAASVAAKVVSDGFLVWDTRFIQYRLLHMEDQLDFAVSLLILLAVYAVCLVIIRIEQEKQTIRSRLEMEKVRLYEETMTDSLTGIRNRNALRVALDKMMADASEAQYVLVMLDMDHFKEINDTYGHVVGDQYIRQLSCVLDSVPEADACRFGGDEFCLLFRGSTRFQVEQSCQRAQETFRDCKLCRTCQEVTVSFGTAQ